MNPELTDELLAVAIAYQKVRKAQRAYFKSRSQADLISSKTVEKDLDALAAAVLAKALHPSTEKDT